MLHIWNFATTILKQKLRNNSNIAFSIKTRILYSTNSFKKPKAETNPTYIPPLKLFVILKGCKQLKKGTNQG